MLMLGIFVVDQRTRGGITRRFAALQLGLPLVTLIALGVVVAVPAIAPAARTPATGGPGLLEPLGLPRAHAAVAPSASDPCPDDPGPDSIPFLLGPPKGEKALGRSTNASRTVATDR